jgi:hypothetical protein
MCKIQVSYTLLQDFSANNRNNKPEHISYTMVSLGTVKKARYHTFPKRKIAKGVKDGDKQEVKNPSFYR